jgi:hypothetical protein
MRKGGRKCNSEGRFVAITMVREFFPSLLDGDSPLRLLWEVVALRAYTVHTPPTHGPDYERWSWEVFVQGIPKRASHQSPLPSPLGRTVSNTPTTAEKHHPGTLTHHCRFFHGGAALYIGSGERQEWETDWSHVTGRAGTICRDTRVIGTSSVGR